MNVVRALVTAAGITALAASPLFAQEAGANAKGYVSGLGGFASSPTNTTGDITFEAGMRVAPHVMVFGNVGRFANLQADLQPTVDTAAANLATNYGIDVLGGGTLPALHVGGGVRVEIPASARLLPYVLGGVSVARLSPSPQFDFTAAGGATLPDGSAPPAGTDVTAMIVSQGYFTSPPSSTAAMFTFGGGAQILVAPHWAVDAGYRYSRIAADATLSATALSTNGLTFGVGYRF